jgi:outer membrane lipoprotein carrier protein
MRFVLTCIVAAWGVSALDAQPAQTADALARRLQQRYQSILDFEADFTQTTSGGVFPITSRAKGHVYVKKPGRMKWVYSEPERSELFWDGKKVYYYFPDAREVTEAAAPEQQGSTSLLFLAGRGDILRDFTPSTSPGTTPGTVGLKLTPRQAEPGFEYFIVELDAKTTQLRSLVTRDNVGADTTTIFSRLRENGGIADRVFVFTPPKGVRVLR